MAGSVQTYFNFTAQAEEALNFYAEVFNSEEAFWGDYFGEVTDRFGIRWMIDTPAKS